MPRTDPETLAQKARFIFQGTVYDKFFLRNRYNEVLTTIAFRTRQDIES